MTTTGKLITVKATEIKKDDVIQFGGVVERVRINKRVSVRQQGHRGPVTYALGEYVRVFREEAGEK